MLRNKKKPQDCFQRESHCYLGREEVIKVKCLEQSLTILSHCWTRDNCLIRFFNLIKLTRPGRCWGERRRKYGDNFVAEKVVFMQCLGFNDFNLWITGVKCEVSEWSEWSSCSVTCGIGERTRVRHVTRHPTRASGGYCPRLSEMSWCGSARNCHRNYFHWR